MIWTPLHCWAKLQVSGFHHESSVFLQACFHPVCSCLHGCDWLHSKWNPLWMLCTNTRLLNRYFQTSTKEKITYINLHPYLAVADPDLQIRGWGRSSRPRDKGVGRVGGGLKKCTLGTRGFSRVRWEFSVLAEGRYIFGRRLKPRAANWQKPETALEKSLAPRVQKMFLWS